MMHSGFASLFGRLKLEQRINTDAEFQLPDPPTLMTAKTYKQRFVAPLIKKLKEVIREMFYHYYKALDSYHRLNTTNGRLYRENEHLTATNDRLKGKNDALRSELKDFRFLRKVLGSRQIDNLIAQAKDIEQQRKQTQRTRRRNTNYER
jgi:plasmid recombination enzyme